MTFSNVRIPFCVFGNDDIAMHDLETAFAWLSYRRPRIGPGAFPSWSWASGVGDDLPMRELLHAPRRCHEPNPTAQQDRTRRRGQWLPRPQRAQVPHRHAGFVPLQDPDDLALRKNDCVSGPGPSMGQNELQTGLIPGGNVKAIGARVSKLTYDRRRERNRSVVDLLSVKIDRCHVITVF